MPHPAIPPAIRRAPRACLSMTRTTRRHPARPSAAFPHA